MKKGKSVRWSMITLIFCSVCSVHFWTVAVQASGFAIVEQSVRGLGTAYAGSAALAEDPSTIFYNPAGMARLSGHQLEAGTHYIIPKAKFEDHGSTHVTGQPLNIHNNDGGDGGESALVPNAYYSHSATEQLKIGIGLHAPFGLKTEYDRNWVGRYHAVESELQTININPTLAYRITPQWSIGAGVSIQWADATLSNKADFGFAGFIGGILPATESQQHDGFAEVDGDDWGYGFNLGILFEPTRSTRFGIAFRSMISHTLKGRIGYEYEDPIAQAVAVGGNFVNGDATAEVDLPETVSLGAYHAFNPTWAMVAGATWTKWRRLDELRIQYNTGQPDTVITLDWDDTWRFDVGLIYQVTDRFTGRFGIAYDESPIPNDQRRTPRIPDEDRYWLAIGGGYSFTDRAELNVGYVHIFVDDPKVDKPATDEDLARGALRGEWDASVDIISLNFNYIF